MTALYEISGLKCSYSQGKRIILEIDKLEIPAGKIVFIIGVSGIGKSTILETLGMMNNTLYQGSQSGFIFHDPVSNRQINLAELWNKQDKVISAFRNRHYSFIFQNTNLMNNLTAYENVYITQLIQGKSLLEVKSRTKEMLRIIGLESIKEDQSITSLSVGQKQRLAFARAIVPAFSVLFCDEPTGNLDVNNAYNLMDVLRKNIYEHNRTAIIVSHDIELAIKYADTIIYIIPGSREGINSDGVAELESYGIISGDSLFYKENKSEWINQNDRYTDESLKQKLIRDLHTISNPV